MKSNLLDSNTSPFSLLNVYKSQAMKKLIEKMSEIPIENSIFYIYGEKGTEKDYILKMILSRMPNHNLIKIPDNSNRKNLRKENIVYLIDDVEKLEISILQNNEQTINCIIFLENLDYDILFSQGRIDLDKYNFLSKAQKIYIPPLSARKQDIVPLANMLLQEISSFLNIPLKELTRDAKEALTEYPWPENFYELKMCLTKSCLNSKHKKLSSRDLFGDFNDKLSIKSFLDSKIGNFLSDFCRIENSNLYDTVIQEVEKALFSLVLSETGNNQLKAAKILGINRNTFRKKLKNYNLI